MLLHAATAVSRRGASAAAAAADTLNTAVRAATAADNAPSAVNALAPRRGHHAGDAAPDGTTHFKTAIKSMGALADAPAPRRLQRAAVIGGGLMGSGIATSLCMTGHDVIVKEVSLGAVEAAVGRISANLGKRVKAGRMSQEEFDAAMGRVSGVTSYDAHVFGDRDIVIESVVEDVPLKQRVFAEVQDAVSADCVLATNTSTLNILTIAEHIEDKTRVAGAHYFSPAHVMPLLEIVRSSETSPQVLSDLVAMAAATNKTPIVVGNCIGFALNRGFAPYMQCANLLADAGLSPYRVDAAIAAFGMPMGPNRMSDMAGVDVVRNADKVLQHYDYAYRSMATQMLVDAGRLGEKSGAGFYAIGDARAATEDADAIAPLLEASREAAQRRNPKFAPGGDATTHAAALSDDDIVRMCMYPVINEYCRILDEGHARNAADLDVASCLGYGFPAATGGPLYWGDHEGGGPAAIVEAMREWRAVYDEPVYEPCDYLVRAAERGSIA